MTSPAFSFPVSDSLNSCRYEFCRGYGFLSVLLRMLVSMVGKKVTETQRFLLIELLSQLTVSAIL